MDKLQKCGKAFEKLLEIQYRIIIGRKGKTVELVIGFSKLDFHHLMGWKTKRFADSCGGLKWTRTIDLSVISRVL